MAHIEVEAEIETMKVLEERIKAPSIWSRLPYGIRFEDLKDSRYISYIYSHKIYMMYNSIYGENYEEIFRLIKERKTKNKMSIAAVKEETEELAGILIMRLQEKSMAKEMLKSAVALAVSANERAISGIFTTERSQKLAKEVILTEAGKNYGAALMAFRIPYVTETIDVKLQRTSRFNIEKYDEDVSGQEKCTPKV